MTPRRAKALSKSVATRLAVVLALSVALLGKVSEAAGQAPAPAPLGRGDEVLVAGGEAGRYGGRLVASLHSEPKTFNPVTALDAPSLEILSLTNGDLIHINRFTQETVPALAKAWKVSSDGLHYTLELRRGVRFSDGQPFDADDVVFTFQVIFDESVHAPQRDLLTINGKPLQVRKLGPYTVAVDLPGPDAAAERLFDSVAILPRHLLQKAYQEKRLGEAWGLSTPPAEIAGLGPFRLKRYVPGQSVELERNPYYWKADRQGHRLPYLDEIAFLIVPNTEAEVLRFRAGEIDVLSRLSAEDFANLSQGSPSEYRLYDLGPGLEYNFLFFNLNDLPEGDSAELQKVGKEQIWFRDVRFRRAVSRAIDRAGIVRLVYRGRAAPLWEHVSPGDKNWVDTSIPHPPRSIPEARELLKEAGFTWDSEGRLLDRGGQRVEFSILSSSGNLARTKMATIIQDDLKQLGMDVHVVPMEFRSLTDRVFNTFDYEACVLGLVGQDADPNPEMNVWLIDGGTHLWRLRHTQPSPPWEIEIDKLMRQQLETLNVAARKKLYDRVQQLVAENLPLICLISPHVLVAAKSSLGNFQPAVLPDYALWNADLLYFKNPGGKAR